MTPRFYAVLGATGKVGREVVSTLRAAGASVRAIVHERRADVPAGCEFVACDVADERAVARALAGADTVHVIVPTGRPDGDVPVQMRRFIESLAVALERVEPARVLAVSDYGAQHANGTGLPALFHDMEARFASLRADLLVLRSAEHMENWARQMARVEATSVLESMHHGVGRRFPTVSARDLGRMAGDMLIETWPRGHRVVHVEGPRRYSALDVAAAFSAILGRNISAIALDRDLWEPTLARTGMSARTAQAIAASFDACNAGLIDVDPQAGDIRTGSTDLVDALRRALGRG